MIDVSTPTSIRTTRVSTSVKPSVWTDVDIALGDQKEERRVMDRTLHTLKNHAAGITCNRHSVN